MNSAKELRKLIEVLGLRKSDVILHGDAQCGSWATPEVDFDVSPEQFLVQAQEDFKAGGNARRLNSLTNSKRAIQAQVDTLILRVGLDPRNMKVQEKWDLVRDIGFVAPRILKRANTSRNRLEHEYVAPCDAEVEDALDLAMLFIESGQRGIGSFSLGNRTEYREQDCDFTFKNELSFAFGFNDKGFKVWAFKDTPEIPFGEVPKRGEYLVGELMISPKETIYIDLIRIGVAVDRGMPERIEPLVHEFFDSLEQLGHSESMRETLNSKAVSGR